MKWFSFFLLVAACWLCECNGGMPEKYTTRYRGIGMYHGVGEPNLPDTDIDKVGKWKANLVRWWLIWWHMPNDITPEAYRQFIAEQCDTLDAKIPAFERNGIKVCLVMGSYPGGRVEIGQWPPHRIFHEIPWQDEFVQTWEYIAARYKDNKTVVMYDLMNEPNSMLAPDVQGLLTLPELFLKTAQAIRAIDAETEIVYEACNDIFKGVEPFDVPGIIYSAHVYVPHLLTHQSVLDNAKLGVTYPGIIGDKYWDRDTLRNHYRDVKRFADDHHVRIFIGEFGCIRWAPNNSAYNYLKDCLEFFEEEGWDWTYFSLEPRCSYNWGATAWSAEHDTIYKSYCAPDEEPDRLTLLRSYFEKNE
jgi:aryl-phospho-beta-D-glucosidase BglC (GH1 family)